MTDSNEVQEPVTQMRILSPTELFHMNNPTPVGMKGVIEMYGDNKVQTQSKGNGMGDVAWEAENLVILRKVAGTNCNIQLHHKVAQFFEQCLVEAMDTEPNYKVRMLGGYCARHQRNDPSLPLSIHSYGAAFDINWDVNPMGKLLVTDLPIGFIAVFKKYGWTWGGDFSSIKDAMHFQYAKGC